MKKNDNKDEQFYKYIGSIHARNTAKNSDDIIKKSSEIDFPDSLDTWFDAYASEHIKNETKKKFKSRVSSIAKRAAIFLIILAIGTFVTTMSVEAYRIRFFNLITKVTDRYTNISIEREPDEDTNKDYTVRESYFYPGHIPVGYKQTDTQSYGELRLTYYQNEKGDEIEFLQTELDPNFQVDTENATTTEININGSKGILVSKEDVKTLLWFTDTNSFFIMGKLNEKEIKTMAESLEFIK